MRIYIAHKIVIGFAPKLCENKIVLDGFLYEL